MCGIVAYVGQRDATPILVGGLRRLEYRGYDSAGVSVWNQGKSQVVRCRGKLDGLAKRLEEAPTPGSIGIGHTRWATHGGPSDTNAHPHKVGRVSVVHNGIIENHVALKEALIQDGAEFRSETDTEIFAHLIARALAGGATSLEAAVRSSVQKVEGSFAIVALDEESPDTLVAARSGSPLVIGLGQEENFVASDLPAILDQTRRALFLEDGDIATLSADAVAVSNFDGNRVERSPREITWTAMQAEKQGYRHFMQKEIHEQPRAVVDTLAGRVDLERREVHLDDVDVDLDRVRRCVILACGSSHHAGLVGKYLIEGLARIPVECDLASEFRYRNPIIGDQDLVVAISQSGETADTMAAVREARNAGAQVLAISNVLESSIPRLADWTLYTHAGPEIGVASTKAFTTQLVAIVLLAVRLGQRFGGLSEERAAELLAELVALPQKMADVIDHGAQLQVIARRYGKARGFLFLGRGAQYPIALEGALKLKEISYIHAEGYAAGEMKHGPIALIDEELPVVVLCPRGDNYHKVTSNLTEVQARGGRVIAVATRGDLDLGAVADEIIFVPDTLPELQPLLTVLPLQLLAYHVASLKGTDIDQPRNLAKSVTVE